MEIVAPVSPTWRNQKLLLALFLTGIGAWFLYDGFLGFPKLNEAFRAHAELKERGAIEEWPKLAQSRGWSAEAPHRLYVQSDLNMQLALGALGLIAGLGTALWVSQVQKTTLRCDDVAFWDLRGRRIPFGAVQSINRKRWETKGLADVFYELPEGKGKVRFDDYKYSGCEKIFAEVEKRHSGSLTTEVPETEKGEG